MNQRQSKYFRTAEKMDDALLSLLEQKPFEYISVSEICARAGVNRSTFYLHYDNTADLLSEATERILNGFLDYFPEENGKRAIPDDGFFISDPYLRPYLSYVRDNRRVFLATLEHQDIFHADELFQRMFENIFSPILSGFRYPSDDQKYVMLFYLNGITAIVLEWLRRDCSDSIDELIRIITECIFGLEKPASANL